MFTRLFARSLAIFGSDDSILPKWMPFMIHSLAQIVIHDKDVIETITISNV